MPHSNIVPAAEPYYFPGGPIGCLLIHGFSCSPEETHLFGEDLNALGYTVHGLRLAGHGTHPQDLADIRAEDWMADVEDGLAKLKKDCQKIVLIGQSLGSCLALTCGGDPSITGVVAISTPYPPPRSPARWFFQTIPALLQPTTQKRGAEPHPTLGVRREAEYPAYPEFPTKILRQLLKIQEIMVKKLPALEVPVLMIESPDDYFILKDETQEIYDSLGGEDKELVWLEGYGHNMLYRPDREKILQLVSEFLDKIS